MPINLKNIVEETLLPLAREYAIMKTPEVPSGFRETIKAFPDGGKYAPTLEDLTREGYANRIATLAKYYRRAGGEKSETLQIMITAYSMKTGLPLPEGIEPRITYSPRGERGAERAAYWQEAPQLTIPLDDLSEEQPLEWLITRWDEELRRGKQPHEVDKLVTQEVRDWALREFNWMERLLLNQKEKEGTPYLHEREDYAYALGMTSGKLTPQRVREIREGLLPVYQERGEQLLKEGLVLSEEWVGAVKKGFLEYLSKGALTSGVSLAQRTQRTVERARVYLTRGGLLEKFEDELRKAEENVFFGESVIAAVKANKAFTQLQYYPPKPSLHNPFFPTLKDALSRRERMEELLRRMPEDEATREISHVYHLLGEAEPHIHALEKVYKTLIGG